MTPDYSTPHRAPRRALVIGMWLFLAALSMLFIAGMLLFFLVRGGLAGRGADNHFHLPALIWISTAVLMTGSYTIHRAVVNLRLERQAKFRFFLHVTAALALLFLTVQTPCMIRILDQHRAMSRAVEAAQPTIQQQAIGIYGAVFFLILVHALHVVGGVIAIGWVTFNAHRGAYDHESYLGVSNAALYWHFLDIVWIVMFTMFLATG